MPDTHLVTGGAGFVGSHLVLALLAEGERVVVLDDLSTGHAAAVPNGALLVDGRIDDPSALARAFAEGPIASLFHFASLSLVGYSIREPYRYLAENTRKVLETLSAREAQVLRLRFGIGERANHTLEEVGQDFEVTRERIRQIEAKALRKLRHPSRSRMLKSFTE